MHILYIYNSTGDIRRGFGTGLWKKIRKDWRSLFQNAAVSLGNGRRTSFWEDSWCGEEALCLTFPSLFNVAAHKEARVAEVWNCSRLNGGWSPTFLRALNDWELDEVERFLHLLFRRKINAYQEDKLLLKNAKFASFVVKTMYRVLDCSPPMTFPFRSIWNPIAPP